MPLRLACRASRWSQRVRGGPDWNVRLGMVNQKEGMGSIAGAVVYSGEVGKRKFGWLYSRQLSIRV